MFPRAAVVIRGLLLATIATVSVVAAIRIKTATDIAKHSRVATDISVFHSQLEEYRKANGSFPTSEQGLQALVREPKAFPPDPWNTPYIYRCPGTRNPSGCDLFSAGPDRKPDTADDDWGDQLIDLTN